MKTETYIIEEDHSKLMQDYERWLSQYEAYEEMTESGDVFVATKSYGCSRIVLHHIYEYYDNEYKLHVILVSALESFENIEEAEAKIHGTIEHFLSTGEFDR